MTTRGSKPLADWHGDPDASAIREEGHLLVDEIYAGSRSRLVEHVRRLQKARSLTALYQAQRALLVEFGARQKAGETLPANRRQVAVEIKELDDSTRQRVLRALVARCDVARIPEGEALKVRAVFRFNLDHELSPATRTATDSSRPRG